MARKRLGARKRPGRLASAPVLVLVLALALALGLGACSAVGGRVQPLQERGLGGVAADTGLRATINAAWLRHDKSLLVHLNLQVHEGRVLVTGALADADLRAEAIRLAWVGEGVREVINEIEITDEGGLLAYARDTAIVAELNSRLLFDRRVRSFNYSAEAVNGTVYLLGLAQDQAELDRVLAIARNVARVQAVASHVLLKDDPRRGPLTSTDRAPASLVPGRREVR